MKSRGIDSVPDRDTRFLSLPRRPDRLWGSPRIRRPEHKAEDSPPYISEVRNEWSYTSTPPCVFMLWIRKTSPSFIVTNYVTCMGRSLSLEANRSSASQGIPRILWNP